jgi:hypothetical protein
MRAVFGTELRAGLKSQGAPSCSRRDSYVRSWHISMHHAPTLVPGQQGLPHACRFAMQVTVGQQQQSMQGLQRCSSITTSSSARHAARVLGPGIHSALRLHKAQLAGWMVQDAQPAGPGHQYRQPGAHATVLGVLLLEHLHVYAQELKDFFGVAGVLGGWWRCSYVRHGSLLTSGILRIHRTHNRAHRAQPSDTHAGGQKRHGNRNCSCWAADPCG